MTRLKCSDKQIEGRNRAGGGKEWREGEKGRFIHKEDLGGGR